MWVLLVFTSSTRLEGGVVGVFLSFFLSEAQVGCSNGLTELCFSSCGRKNSLGYHTWGFSVRV